MPTTETFENLYKKLNPQQKKAVDTIEGPVMVIAGPGTGKTHILSLRIANILQKTDTPPDAILALTFTESGVRAMRKRLATIIGGAAYRVKIHTFHSFANDIIKTYPDKFPRIIGSEHVQGLEQLALVEKILEEGEYQKLRPKGEPTYYVSKIISAIKDLKREGISPVKLSELIDAEEKKTLAAPDLRHEKGKYAGEMKGKYQDELENCAKNRELQRAYVAYEQSLEGHRLYDFEDMIIEVVKRLTEDKNLLLKLQEESQYILADEHQDANASQNSLLELIASFHDRPNLFVVGDEKQAIFRFQGASLQNFLYFKRKYPDAELVKLSDNYRSHQIILDAAHELIGNNQTADESLRVKLAAKSGQENKTIDCVSLPNGEAELAFVAEEARKLIDAGVAPSQIAVLVRNNNHAEPVERALRSGGVPVARFADSDALNHPHIAVFFNLIRAALKPASNELVSRALLAPFLGLDFVTVSQVLEQCRKEKASLIDCLRGHNETKSFAEQLVRFGRLASSDPVVEAFETIATESGFINHIVSHQKSRELIPLYAAVLSTIVRFAERERSATLADFMDRLDRAREHDFKITASYMPPEGIQLMTAHGSKGLEFDYVFIVHASDNVWGGAHGRRAFKLPDGVVGPGLAVEDAVEDERRLFYVALTRAKKHVFITSAEQDADGKELSPSRFILEIPGTHLKHAKPQPSTRISAEASQTVSLVADKGYLQKLFLERGFAVTHLNNFLKCPWQYFFVNLIQIPKAQENPQMYGSAIHNALRDYFEAYKREEDISIDQAVSLFESYLRRTAMPERDLVQYIADGRDELAAYLSAYQFPRSIWNEYKISGVPFAVDDVEIVLNGNLDKVELVGTHEVNVVDYKTGKPKSRNEIEGKTKNADGDYKRQLVFYKLLIDRYKSGEWNMKTGTLDFIKPENSGKLRREIFTIADSEISELELLIKDVAGKILNLDFKGCGKADCEWCALRNL
jgi:DNA helicase II / ATP-dependent DNA helicase PcrA